MDTNPAPDEVPKAVVSRLSLYLRELHNLERDGKSTTSSTQLGRRLGVTDAQVRKDLAYFGQFGYPGIGYHCDELISAIKNILGTNRKWPVALVGIGNLGRALLRYKGFADQGFSIAAAFDINPDVVGKELAGVKVYDFGQFSQIVAEKGIELAMLAVPVQSAQDVADQIVGSGITGVLNFAPVTISLPPHVSTVGVDLAIELEQLSFAVARSRRSRESDDSGDQDPSGDQDASGDQDPSGDQSKKLG